MYVNTCLKLYIRIILSSLQLYPAQSPRVNQSWIVIIQHCFKKGLSRDFGNGCNRDFQSEIECAEEHILVFCLFSQLNYHFIFIILLYIS
jgi:hypothetical protein